MSRTEQWNLGQTTVDLFAKWPDYLNFLLTQDLPVVNLFLTRDSLYSWLLSSKFSFEMVAPLHVNWTAIRDGVLGPCVKSNLALKEPNNSNQDHINQTVLIS